MDHVEAEQERYVKARALDGLALALVGVLRGHRVEDRPDLSLRDEVLFKAGLGRPGVAADGDLVKLPRLLLQAHRGKEGIDPGLGCR